jgi:hypothetical protein
VKPCTSAVGVMTMTTGVGVPPTFATTVSASAVITWVSTLSGCWTTFVSGPPPPTTTTSVPPPTTCVSTRVIGSSFTGGRSTGCGSVTVIGPYVTNSELCVCVNVREVVTVELEVMVVGKTPWEILPGSVNVVAPVVGKSVSVTIGLGCVPFPVTVGKIVMVLVPVPMVVKAVVIGGTVNEVVISVVMTVVMTVVPVVTKMEV